MTLRLLAATAAIAILGMLPSPSFARTQLTVDWSAIHSFVGTYHAASRYLSGPNNGAREEVSGRATIPLNRSYSVGSGYVDYEFAGTAQMSASISGPIPKGPCGLYEYHIPTHVVSNRTARIFISLDLKRRIYSWQAEPITIHYEERGYSKICDEYPTHLTVGYLGSAEAGNLPLPTTTDVLCGTKTLSVPDESGYTARISWSFIPKGGKPGPLVCPSFAGHNGGTDLTEW